MKPELIFHRGDRVVCVCDTPPKKLEVSHRLVLGRLKRGTVYTVTDVVTLGGVRGLHLAEIDHRPTEGWRAWRFRKIMPADESFRKLVIRVAERNSVSEQVAFNPA